MRTRSLPADTRPYTDLAEIIMKNTGTKTLDHHPRSAAHSKTAPPLCAHADRDTPAPGNDNATVGGVPDTTPLLAHPDVVRYLRATLRRHGVASDAMADAIADVQTRSIEAARARRMPADLVQWKALTATIAARWALDRRREARARGKYEAGLCGDADAHAHPAPHREHRHPVDTKRYLAVLKEQLDAGQMPEDAAEILWGEAEQVPHAEIGAEVGVSANAVEKRLVRMRATFRAKLAALGMLILALLGLWALLVPSSEVAAPPPRESTPPVGSRPAWDGAASPPQNSSASAAENRPVYD